MESQGWRLGESNWRELLLWLLRRRRRFRVAEMSMAPLLEPGDEVLVDPRAYRQQRPLPGDIVIAQHPSRPDFKLIKRVTAVFEDGRLFLQGDNLAESNDSRAFGALPPDHILGKVTSKFG